MFYTKEDCKLWFKLFFNFIKCTFGQKIMKLVVVS